MINFQDLFSPHLLKVVGEVKSLLPPHLLEVWLMVSNGSLHVPCFCAIKFCFAAVEFCEVIMTSTKLW